MATKPGCVCDDPEDCMTRLRLEREEHKQTTKFKEMVQEIERMDKLRCVDEAHSLSLGLTTANANKLIDKLQKMSKLDNELPCAKDELIACIQKYPNCFIRCRKEVAQFIDCVDLHRVNKIKNKIEEERKESRRAEVNDLLKQSIENKDKEDEM